MTSRELHLEILFLSTATAHERVQTILTCTDSKKRLHSVPRGSSSQAKMEPTEKEVKENHRPLKRYFRQRAHCNPLSHNDTFT